MKISYGNSRFDKDWKNGDITWVDFNNMVSSPARTPETIEEYQKMTKEQQTDIKDKGGFVFGHLKDGKRRKNMVLSRSAIALDMDYATPDVWDSVIEKLPYRCCVYSTHKHTPEKPRLRIIIPLSRDVTEAEYPAVARMVAKDIGIDMFDDSTYEAHRLMFWPTTSMNGEFFYRGKDGCDLDPDEILSRYDDWQDMSTWPMSSRQPALKAREFKKVADPLTKPVVIGAYCRAHSIADLIETRLSHIYAPTSMPNRYTYIPGEGAAGLAVEGDKLAYSHHATDPAHGKLMNAFDLDRVHTFGHLDENCPEDTPVTELPSYKAMVDYALQDEKVRLQLAQDHMVQAADDFSVSADSDVDWKKKLSFDRAGNLQSTLRNLTLILQNDEKLKGIVFNQLADGMEIKGEVPWKHPSRFWRDADDAQLVSYIDTNYGTFSARNYTIAVTKVTDDRSYHPIREMFESLPPWDNVKRAETVLIDYLGAEDNSYVRAVTRKALCAAYMRVYQPGIKFDNLIVLNGDQGIGKSTLIASLGGEWFSDSLSLSDMNDKTAAEKLQGYWLMEIGELAGMKKADIDKVKAFLSRQDDKYRASFGRRVAPHPRQCVFFGTTNSENGYLRDITGNRRFWNVMVTGHGKYTPWDLSKEVVEQIWAEVAVIAKGEKLYLDAKLEAYAKEEQRRAMEQDEREGIVRNYLDTLLPENWDSMDSYRRREYIRDVDDPTRPKGTVKRMSVSNIEIWCECFGKPKEDMRSSDSYAISAIMVRIDGWEKAGARAILPIYGRQRVYTRTA